MPSNKENKTSKDNTEKQTKETKDMKVKEKKVKVKKDTDKKGFHITRLHLFTILNIIATVSIVYLLGSIKQKAITLKELINAQQNAEQSSKVNFSDLELKSNQEKADMIISLFPNDQGLLGFIQMIEDKSRNGSVKNFSFASKEPVRDSTTRLGIPVVVSFRGTWSEIDKDLRDIQKEPYLFRPITIEAKVTAEDGVINFMYGGFLYVDESF